MLLSFSFIIFYEIKDYFLLSFIGVNSFYLFFFYITFLFFLFLIGVFFLLAILKK